MYRIIYPFSALVLLTVYSGCDDDSLSQTVEIPLPEHVSRTVISMDLRTGDTLLTPVITRSTGLLDERPDDVQSGVLELYRNDELIGRMENVEEFPRMELGEPIADEPASYRLVGMLEGYETATASQVMPARPEFTLTRYEPDGGIDAGGFEVDILEFDLNDDLAREDFYAIRVLIPSLSCSQVGDTVICEPDFSFPQVTYIETSDPLFQDAEQYGLLIRDQSFNGQSYPVSLRVDNFSEGPIMLEIINFTEDGFRYAVSRAAYQRSRDNPFAEPVNVHDNVENGYGHFILGNTVREIIE